MMKRNDLTICFTLFQRKSFIVCIVLALFSLLCFYITVDAENNIEKPVFSASPGFYTEAFHLELRHPDPGIAIYYTYDGSPPTIGDMNTHPYTEPIRITNLALRVQPSPFFCATVIRSIAVDSEGNQSKVSTGTYFVDSKIHSRYQLPVVSIVTDYDNLYDSATGIMNQRNTQNRGLEWERPIHFEYFTKDGKLAVSMDAGVRLHGAASRDWEFKSLRLYARKEYDTKSQFEYDFFGNSVVPSLVKNGQAKGDSITEFKRLILRSSGNEGTAGDGILFRDALSQALMANSSLDLQGYQAVITFLNGEYYGIQNMRERQDEKYIEGHYNIDETEVIIYEFEYDNETGEQITSIAHGEEVDLVFYNELIAFLETQDISITENYEIVKTMVDIENFVDYQIINIYGANRDWPGNNCKVWRVRTEYNPEAAYGLDGRIRFLVYDMDFNFGLYNAGAVSLDSLADAMATHNTSYPNPYGSTLLFSSLLENEEFRTYFVQRFLDLINSNFDKDYVKSLVDSMAVSYRPSIEEFRNRYKLLHDWNRNLDIVKEFADNREVYVKNHLASTFNLGSFYFLGLELGTSPIGGVVQLNTITLDHSSNGIKDGLWKKTYYSEVPVTITAIPHQGYKFSHWEGSSHSTEDTIHIRDTFQGTESITLKPVFITTDVENKDLQLQNTDTTVVESSNSDESSRPVMNPEVANVTVVDSNFTWITIAVLVLIILIMGGYILFQRKRS